MDTYIGVWIREVPLHSQCDCVSNVRCTVPGTEAHGGYTFCGFAALSLLQKTHLCDARRLLVSLASSLPPIVHTYFMVCSIPYSSLQRWTCRRQMKVEGGFQVHICTYIHAQRVYVSN